MENKVRNSKHQKATAPASRQAAVDELRRAQNEVGELRSRVSQLESAGARSVAEGKRRNVNDAVREALITSLQAENKRLLIRIDKDAFHLATAEDRLRALSKELIVAYENEQRRISREIHDQIGQDITALKLLIARGNQASGKKANPLLAEAASIAEDMLQKVRDICSRLRPQVLDDLGLVAGLSVHLKNFGNRSGLSIEFEHGPIAQHPLPPVVESVIFRVVQEAVTNVARHAKTRRARVTMGMEGDDVIVAIEDKGCGFDYKRVKKVHTTGISSMAERVLLVDGVCEIASIQGGGTSVTVRIPLTTGEAMKD